MSSVFYILVVLLLMPSMKGGASLRRHNCSMHRNAVTSIGVVIDGNTRVGKEQKIAMKIAVRDIYRNSCCPVTLHVRDFSEGSVHATNIASKLMQSKKVEVLIGAFSLTEAVFLSEMYKNLLGVPIFLLNPTAMPQPLVPLPSNLLQMSHNFSVHMQCLSAIVGHFRWRRVTILYERSNLFAMDSAHFTVLSDSLRSVDAIVEQHIAFPSVSTLSEPDAVIEKELYTLKRGGNRVYVVLHSSLELATRLFQKANEMGMVEKGFVWIISDEIASLLYSVQPSVIASMQGVLGYRTNIIDSSRSYKEFVVKFKQSYIAKFPYDQGNPNPTLFALRAYDMIHAITKSKNAAVKSNSTELFPNLLLSNFEGLSGNISFRNSELKDIPTFQIINVVGKSYRELVFWSSEFGFYNKQSSKTGTKETRNYSQNHDMLVELGPIYWPGGLQEVPRGWNIGATSEKPLIIGVPASGAFRLVNVTIVAPNQTSITGFVIDVFNTSLKYLPYDLPHKLVPYYGRYDDLVLQIHKKVFDAAVGDILILDERYRWADFSQPFVKSGMNMVVTVKEDNTKEIWIFAMVFEKKLWILFLSMGLFIGFVVWLVERRRNPDFADGSVSQQLGAIFWFSFTLLFFAQKESPRSNLSKMVLVPWYLLILMLTIYFQASLTSLMTVSQLLPSVKDVETLRAENAVVGCNWNSFVCTYLENVLRFKPENIKKMRAVEDYPPAFERGEIKAAFFVTLHAKVFLTKYCRGYTLAGPTYNFGGFGFAFRKGSVLSADISQAILKATEKGEIEGLEHDMFTHCKCSTSKINNSTTFVGPKPFSGLFCISGGVAAVALLVIVIPSVELQSRIFSVVKESILRSRICSWLSMMLRHQTSTRLGKEKEIAMKIAVQDVYRDSCIQLTLHFRYSESSNSATSTALKLMHKNKVQAIIGTFSLPEAAVLSEVHKNFLDIPVIFLPPTAVLAASLFTTNAIIQFDPNWRKVTVIYERSNNFSLDSDIISVLSDSLKSVDSSVEQHLAFPPINSLSDPEAAIEQEFRKLSIRRNRVFVVLQSSLQLATCVFQKAHQMGLVEKGFVWIISDEIASLFDSVDSSVIASMQGVIGYKTSFIDTSKLYKKFKIRFERSYLTKHPNDQGNPYPSIYALRAYDAVQAIGNAKKGFSRKVLL
uniref:Ionotropic glutamate receptor C-terminal domain-containing protein n=1 Tax=Chenopodium quinoa TaxID=63459 RepID=A0A803LK56_CHEQI